MIKNHTLDEEICGLRKELIHVQNKVFLAIQNAKKALYECDFNLAKQIIREDTYINHLEVEIEKICLKIFALKQPMAYDLRFILSVIKINRDLERIGDFASIISQEVVALNLKIEFFEENSDLFQHIKKNFDMIEEMLKNSFLAFMSKDSEQAQIIFFKDQEIDYLYKKLYKMIYDKMEAASLKIEIGMRLINMLKALERMGDYSKNICEQTIYLDRGEIVRHWLSK